ncbi:hypothetical protein J1605_006096 [Eschrichtius robustus]|uniref:Uncharacterized protein n=1 Tax=Eschrichtius robustus TaxID=9764 RepID=A0AB34H5X7_ESCRO|nr:hypothetical protein J1605_006096 [Eschrichtius robustus]
MGSILSRRIAGVEDIDIQANSAYRYPPKSASLHGGPRALRPDPGAWVGTALTASSRLGDLGSVGSLLRASAPSYAHWGMLNRNPPGLA